jgi:RNA polymerase sigma-70 factor (ECF subfamily)
MDYTESEIVQQLRQSNEKVFEYLFQQYHVALFRFSLKYVRMPDVAEEIVHDVLLYLWQHRNTLLIKVSLQAYLYTATKHRSLDYLKSQYAQQSYESELPDLPAIHSQPDADLHQQELAGFIQRAIEVLPERCRIIYTMHRTAELTYKEIAEQLGISPKTVEAQMGIALQRLRKYLQEHWTTLFWLPLGYLLAGLIG